MSLSKSGIHNSFLLLPWEVIGSSLRISPHFADHLLVSGSCLHRRRSERGKLKQMENLQELSPCEAMEKPVEKRWGSDRELSYFSVIWMKPWREPKEETQKSCETPRKTCRLSKSTGRGPLFCLLPLNKTNFSNHILETSEHCNIAQILGA